ncbi:PAS domain-containing protein [Amycolatopsis sp. NPDC004378]
MTDTPKSTAPLAPAIRETDDENATVWWGRSWAAALGEMSFVVKNEQRLFVHVSAGFADRLATAPDALVGLSDADLEMDEADRDRIRSEEDAAIAQRVPIVTMVRYRQGDGWTGYGSGVRFPVTGPSGEPGVGCLFLDVSAQVRAQERFELFINQTSVLATIKDRDQQFVWVSRMVAERYGLPLEDIVGRTPAELFGAEFGAENRAQDETMLAAGGRPMAVDFAWPLDPRDPTRLRGSRFSFTDHDGRTLIGTMLVDVSDEHRARQQAGAAEARFTEFMRHSPAAAVVKSADGRYVWANPAYHHTYHTDPHSFLGSTIYDLTSREQADYATRLDQQVLTSGKPLRDVQRYQRGDGTTGVDLGFRFVLALPDGTTGLGGVFIDITELHETRARAQDAEARYRQLFEYAGLPIVVFDLDGYVINANVAYTQLVGRPLSVLQGMPIKALITQSTRDKDTDRWRRLVTGELRVYRSRATLRHGNGHIVPTIATQALITHPDGSPKYVYSVAAPIGDADADPDRRGGEEHLPQLDDERLGREEHTILTTLAAGGTLSEVERNLHLSRAGVQHHLDKLRRRLGLGPDIRTGGLVARAYAHGILQPGTWPPRTTREPL